MKLGVYGGTFNPVHYGHLRTAEEVREKLSLDRILFIPAGKTPFNKPEMAGALHRYNMVKLAIAGNPAFDLSGIEVRTRTRSYTVDTIKKLRARYRGAELFFILGTDAFLDLQHWKQPDRLVTLTNFVVISRPGFPFRSLTSSPYLKHIPRSVLKALETGRRDISAFDIPGGQKGYLCRVTGLDISASRVRDLLTAGKKIRYLLPESVENYIISHKLYRKRQGCGMDRACGKNAEETLN